MTTSGSDVVIELDLDRDGIADVADYDGDAAADAVSVTVLNTTVAELTATDFVL